MFLTSLSMRGFKSFADATTIEVEPGVTVVVGPNGSGKSNVVDALAWVLGTNSPKKVRGGSMQDVIFAGSPSRAPSSMARVEITIDNSDGLLGGDGLGVAGSAQEFREIRVAREITTSGDSRYLINGADVRAMDVQELLSDAGLGRELHTIVGQGQLDAILNARPEERRAYIEEAAGILKHRRRRERAIRKLEHVEGHVEKLALVLRELRRELRPLERQAEAANKAADLQAALREVRLAVAVHDHHHLAAAVAVGADADRETSSRQATVEEQAEAERRRVATLTERLAEEQPAAGRAAGTFHRLQELRERLRGTADLVDARRRHLLEYEDEPLAGRPPEDLRAQADELAVTSRERGAERDVARDVLAAAQGGRRDAEAARRAFDHRRQAEAQRRQQAREQRLRWEGQVQARRGAVASSAAERGRVEAQLTQVDERIADTSADVAAVEQELRAADLREGELTHALEASEEALDAAAARHDALRGQERELERERSSQGARAEALRAALADRGDGVAALLAHPDGPPLLGALADLVHVADVDRVAATAALGPLADALVVDDAAAAIAALQLVARDELGRVTVLATQDAPAASGAVPDVVDGVVVRPAAHLVEVSPRAPEGVGTRAVAALHAALAGTVVVASLADALVVHGARRDLRVVTCDGELIAAGAWTGGAHQRDSAVATSSAATDAQARADAADAELARLAEEVAAADAALLEARRRHADATLRINESDAAITAAAERLARIHRERQRHERQRELVVAQQEELDALLARDEATLATLLADGPADEVVDDADEEAWLVEQRQLDAAVEDAREAELDARVVVERLEEHLRHLARTQQDLRAEADQVERAMALQARRREQRRQGVVRCGELAETAALALRAVDDAIVAAREERDRLAALVRHRNERLTEARTALDALTSRLDDVRAARHEAELAQAARVRDLDELVTRLRTEFSLAPEEAAAAAPEAAAADRAALLSDAEVLERKLGLLGRVNPLALEQFQALEQRHAFLSDQLADLRASRRDLEQVVATVDDRIREVFAAAFADVAREFDITFQTVFPGGEGRLVLTDPDDLLATGIEVEARPPGKKVTRLSLLSGGERSLTVLAFVFAIFRARPSPFYVLDEVDAALDDVNLQRLLRVLTSFRERAQLIVVTHQKRSMEIADLMYGVTMGADAVTRVVAERFVEDDVAQLLEGANQG